MDNIILDNIHCQWISNFSLREFLSLLFSYFEFEEVSLPRPIRKWFGHCLL